MSNRQVKISSSTSPSAKSENQQQSTHCRPREHLVAIGKRYPSAWKDADELRAVQSPALQWPKWCFLPLSRWHAIARAGTTANRDSITLFSDSSELGAIGAWRVTQGIYRFDSTLFDEVAKTSLEGDLPCEVLYYLPEWCIYVETPGMECILGTVHGYFAHLQYDMESDGAELRLLLDIDDLLLPIPVVLGPWSLLEALRRTAREAFGSMGNMAAASLPLATVQPMHKIIEPLVSLLLYLCSENAEISADGRRPVNPLPKKTKKGMRLFPPNQPEVWGVGVRLGTALRQAWTQQREDQGGTHAGPRPHIRRAHWHGFRSGPVKQANGTPIPTNERKFTLRWLPPISVIVHSVDDLPATIRPLPSTPLS